MSAVARAASLAGLDPAAVGVDNMSRAVRAALERLGISEEAYLARLAADPAERRALAGAAVVQETWLFRNPPIFQALGRLAGTLARPVRVLSVPCATGEEAASIASTLLAAGLAPEEFLVDAADASPQALAMARLGRFGPASLRGGPPDCPGLRQHGEDMILAPELLGRIRFLEADILDEGVLAGNPPYHAVFCNNLLIYLSAPARVRMAANLARLVAPGGALFTSPAEAPAMADLGLRTHDLYDGRDALTVSPAERAPDGRIAGLSKVPQSVSHDSRAISPGSQRPADGRSGAVRTDAARLDAPRTDLVVLAAGRPESLSPLARARGLADAGKLPEALELVDAELDGGGRHAEAYHLKGVIHLAQGERDAAEHAFRRALYLDPGHVESLGHLELLARADGRQAEAGILAGRARRADTAGLDGEERP